MSETLDLGQELLGAGLVRALAWGWVLVYLVPALFRATDRPARTHRQTPDRSPCREGAAAVIRTARPSEAAAVRVRQPGASRRPAPHLWRSAKSSDTPARGRVRSVFHRSRAERDRGRRRTAGRLDAGGLHPFTEVPLRVRRACFAIGRVRRDQHRASAVERPVVWLGWLQAGARADRHDPQFDRRPGPVRDSSDRARGPVQPSVRLGHALADHAARDTGHRGLAQCPRQRASWSMAVGLPSTVVYNGTDLAPFHAPADPECVFARSSDGRRTAGSWLMWVASERAEEPRGRPGDDAAGPRAGPHRTIAARSAAVLVVTTSSAGSTGSNFATSCASPATGTISRGS